ncbi:hypothetical protein MUO79_04605 [Candidatus Bathyarchaeota archaeon]|nr:hypothetical protein [Candidatus Bathyarchaeota archaeon]
MVKKKMENILAEELKRKFDQSPKPKYDKIFVSKKPFQVKSLKEKWFEIYGKPLRVDPKLVPPLQPEIDMILCKGRTMMAIELKYFRRKGRGLDHSFYEGIEQALALLRWGFDYVALWQLFEHPSIGKDELWFYGGWTWNFLHAPPEYGGLNLPLEFTFMLVRKKNQGYDFLPIQPERIGGSIRLAVLYPPYDPRFEIRTPHRNTLLSCSEVIRLREMLDEWLETQKP